MGFVFSEIDWYIHKDDPTRMFKASTYIHRKGWVDVQGYWWLGSDGPVGWQGDTVNLADLIPTTLPPV